MSTITYSDLNASQMLTSDVATLIKSDRVKDDVATQLGLPNLRAFEIDVTSSTATRVITLAVTNENPELATNVANAIVDDISKVATEVMQVESINIIDRATVPDTPSGPRRILICVMGTAIGFLLSVLLIVIQDSVDKRVRDDKEAEKLTGVSVIGHFPAVKV